MSAIVAQIGVKFCMIIHVGPGQIFPFLGAVPSAGSQNPKFWLSEKANILKKVSRSFTCQY